MASLTIRRFILLALLIVAVCGVGSSLFAEQPPLGPIPAAASGPNIDPAAATQAYLATIPPEAKARSDAYFEGGYWLLLWDALLAIGICCLLLFTGWSAAWRRLGLKLGRWRFLATAIYAVIFTVVIQLLTSPLNAYENFFREKQYGMATQTFGGWLGEQATALVVQAIIAAIFLPVLYAVLRRTPRTWWAWGSGVMILFAALANVVGPVLIMPLFNDYKPLVDPAVRDPILALARANQIPVDHVNEFDASRQTKRVSANVSGGFGVAQINLNDNLLQRCSLPEIRQVMAHEMGHYVLNHTYKLLLEFAVMIVVVAFFTRSIFDALVRRFGAVWQVEGIGDPAGAPVLLMTFTALFLLATPISNSMTREVEGEADSFGINTSREPDGFAQASIKLGEYRKMNPSPIEETVFFDHPSGRARIMKAMEWKAAHLPAGGGQP